MSSPYNKGRSYNATTQRYGRLMDVLVQQVLIATPAYYPPDKQKKLATFAILDTGAQRSCISASFASKLGLVPVEKATVCGVGGKQEANVYDARLDFNPYLKDVPIRVFEAKLNKDDGASEFGAQACFLVGMDILGQGDFFTGRYLDSDGKPCTMFSFRFPSAMEPVDYKQEIDDFNRHVEEQNRKASEYAWRKTHQPSRKSKGRRH